MRRETILLLLVPVLVLVAVVLTWPAVLFLIALFGLTFVLLTGLLILAAAVTLIAKFFLIPAFVAKKREGVIPGSYRLEEVKEPRREED
ncbi:TPA: hypothetical protein EYP44_02755 [Candidatus Bathyarchaeota archaeon]|nr:hypothetical protein [Candidatus Bathyarchaeota archaeon]